MIDLTATIKPKSDQLNADDLIAGPKTITVTGVKLVAEDQPVAISFHGDDGKPYKPCKSMRRVLVKAWGADGSKYVGRSLTLYLDESVKFGGAAVGGIRIAELSDSSCPGVMALTATRGTKRAFTVKPMDTPPKQAEKLSEADIGILIAAGNAASSEGVAMYKNWLAGLNAEQKEAIRPHHAEWSANAKKAVDNQYPALSVTAPTLDRLRQEANTRALVEQVTNAASEKQIQANAPEMVGATQKT